MATKQERKQLVSTIESAANQGPEMLGCLVYWSLSDTECRIKPATLEALFDGVGLDKDAWFPPHIKATVAFRKTLREAKRSSRAVLLRAIADNAKHIVYGVVTESVDEANEDLEYAVPARLIFNKETESVHTKGHHPTVQHIKDMYDGYLEDFVSWDVRRMLTRNIAHSMRSIPLRPSGGVYFAPARWLPEVLKHQQIVDQIPGCEMTVIRVAAGENNEHNLGRNTKVALRGELEAVKAQIEAFKTGKSPRASTLERRVAEFKELKQRAEMYASMLSIQVTDITDGLTECEEQVLLMLDAVRSEDDGAKAARKARKAQAAEEDKAATRRVRKVKSEGNGKRHPAAKPIKVDEEVNLLKKLKAKKAKAAERRATA